MRRIVEALKQHKAGMRQALAFMQQVVRGMEQAECAVQAAEDRLLDAKDLASQLQGDIAMAKEDPRLGSDPELLALVEDVEDVDLHFAVSVLVDEAEKRTEEWSRVLKAMMSRAQEGEHQLNQLMPSVDQLLSTAAQLVD